MPETKPDSKSYLRKFRRALRLAQAFLSLPRLNRRADSLLKRPEDLTSLLFAYSDGIIQPIQVKEELSQLLADVERLRPRTVLEIGTCCGGTLYLWTRLAQPDAIIISIDLPGAAFGGGYSLVRKSLYQRFSRERQSLHLLRSDSHAAATMDHVKRLLGGRPVDLLFIDGDHTYEGVSLDWKMYSQLLSPNGIAVFHDVAGNYGETQVKRLWDAIKTGRAYREYIADPGGCYGIGLLLPESEQNSGSIGT